MALSMVVLLQIPETKARQGTVGATLCNQTHATYKPYLNDLIDTSVQRFVKESGKERGLFTSISTVVLGQARMGARVQKNRIV